MFPTVDIALKNGKLFSNQRSNGVHSFALLKDSYFLESMVNDLVVFKLEAEKLLKKSTLWLRELKNSDALTIEQKEGKLHISSEQGSFTFDIDFPKDCDIKRPFSLERWVPCPWKFDTHFKVKLSDVKELTRRIKKDYFSFVIKDRQLFLVVWGLRQVVFIRKPQHKIFNGKNLNVTFSREIDKVIQAFSEDMIHVHTKTGQPTWFSEESKDYSFGVMLANVDKSPIF